MINHCEVQDTIIVLLLHHENCRFLLILSCF